MTKIKGLLLDLDGTLYFKNQLIENAVSTINQLKQEGYNICYMTNTDAKSPRYLYEKLKQYGFDLEEADVITPVSASLKYLKNKKVKSVYPLVSQEVEHCFRDFQNDQNIEYVVVGDFRDQMTYEKINQAYRYMDEGAEILALQKGRFFYTQEGKNINTGAFVKMFEYASGKEALLLGKPSTDFFQIGIDQLGCKPSEVIIVGDDITTDIKGANEIGANSVMVKTGKYTKDILAQNPNIKPDYIIGDIAKIKELLKNIK